MKFTKLIRNKKAISPIFATLILIAIAVIAGIVVYMFTSGTIATMTGGGTTGTEKVAISACEGSELSGQITVYAKSTGGGNVALDSAIVKDADGLIVGTPDSAPGGGPITADLTTITVSGTGILEGNLYTVTLISEAGGNFVSPAFKAGA